MIAFIALGANLGDPASTLCEAVRALEATGKIKINKKSSLYRTAPIDSSGPDYVNAVIEVSTTEKSEDLLRTLLRIEKLFGRIRPAGIINAPRTLDLDLLLCGNLIRKTPILTLPHPRMHQRAFVLVPLLEIEPEIVIPGLGKASQFLAGVSDQKIEKLDSKF